MKRKRRRVQQSEDVDNFYTSWSDLVSLLLVFFIYLFSISEINVVKFFDAKKSMQGEMLIDEITQQEMLANIQATQKKLEELKENIEIYIEENDLQSAMTMESFQDRIELNLGNKVLFKSGSSDLRGAAKTILNSISGMFENTEGLIFVEGHTDDQPIHTAKYKSNWDLSSARASSVVSFMSKSGVTEDRFVVMGFSQFRPVTENVDADSRSRNRRVKIVLKPYESKISLREEVE